METIAAIILGLVQGLTEFLPVSSSGHLAIAGSLLGTDLDGNIEFDVIVHAATVLATIIVFWKEIVSLFKGFFKFKYNDETAYLLKIAVSMIPVFVVGMFFKDEVEALFSSLTVVGVALVMTAILLFFSDRKKLSDSSSSAHRNGISYGQAFIVGLGQALAVIPGLSRSGTTISTGLLCGVKREVVAQFSFLMVLVPILGETFLDFIGGDFAASSLGVGPLVAGFVAAFISGLFSCKVMIALVKKAELKWFALYCVTVGVATVIFSVI